MPTPNTTSSIGDINLISLLQESGLTAQQVADSILKAKDSILNGVTKVGTIALLRQLTTPLPTVWVSGYHTIGDGVFGSNLFEWDSTSVEDDNGGTIIKLDHKEIGRYELKYTGKLNALFFGVKNNGEDNQNRIQEVIETCRNRGYKLFNNFGIATTLYSQMEYTLVTH